MQTRTLATILAGGLALTGSARWEPPRGEGAVTFERACPLRRAPRIAAFGQAGVRGVYQFAVSGADEPALEAFLAASHAAGFGVAPMTLEMNFVDTLIVWGPVVLHDQRAVDREFRTACRLGKGRIYLTHVRHNPPGRPGASEQVR